MWAIATEDLIVHRLVDLQEGDVKTSDDFREVDAAVLEDWLGAEAMKIIYGRFVKAQLLSS